MNRTISSNILSDILGVSRTTISNWVGMGKITPQSTESGIHHFLPQELSLFPEVRDMFESDWEKEANTVPNREYTSIELFAGAGGLALGLHKAGLSPILLNEIIPDAANTLLSNRPDWNIVCDDIKNLSFTDYKGKVDIIAGGFPCQAFSYAGKKGGFDDARGTLFFDFARAVSEVQPKIMVGENVRGLLNHDNGNTLRTIREVIDNIGYHLIEPRVLKAIFYKVPQKRERLFLIAIRKDLYEAGLRFEWPSPYRRVLTLRDAFYAGELYDTDVPPSAGQKYPPKKEAVMKLVPMGGNWNDLPLEIQKEYLGKSYFLGGGKTGIARRLSLDEPSLTLTCAPAQKQTERCHPIETRPLTIREYARIQTFPDEWVFKGSITSQYKQIGNAVPVNLALAVGKSIVKALNTFEANNKHNACG